MNETQQSISQWSLDTFGDSGSNARIAARSHEEMSELLRALTADDNAPTAAEESADVLIPLLRLAERIGFQIVLESSHFSKLTSSYNNTHCAARAGCELSNIILYLASDDEDIMIRYSCYVIVTHLLELAHRMGFNLQEEIDKKMAINRNRVWEVGEDGINYHVRKKE